MTPDTLTPRQRLALQGKLTLEDWNAEGADLFRLGLVGLDPLAEACGRPTVWTLTEQGRKVAHAVRKDSIYAR